MQLNLGPQTQKKGTDSLLLGLNNYVHPLTIRPTSLRSIDLSDSPCWNRQVSKVCSPRLAHTTPTEIEPSSVVKNNKGRIDLHHRDRVGIASTRVRERIFLACFLASDVNTNSHAFRNDLDAMWHNQPSVISLDGNLVSFPSGISFQNDISLWFIYGHQEAGVPARKLDHVQHGFTTQSRAAGHRAGQKYRVGYATTDDCRASHTQTRTNPSHLGSV